MEMTVRAIAAELGVRTKVRLWDCQTLQRSAKGGGRKRAPRHEVLSERDKCILLQAIARNPYIRPKDMKALILDKASTSTIMRFTRKH